MSFGEGSDGGQREGTVNNYLWFGIWSLGLRQYFEMNGKGRYLGLGCVYVYICMCLVGVFMCIYMCYICDVCSSGVYVYI